MNEKSHPERFYRVHKQNTYTIDEEFEEVMQITGAVVKVEVYRIISATPKGYWITPVRWAQNAPSKVWVSATGRKRHAYPTKKEALESFYQRQKRRIQHLRAAMYQAEKALEYAKQNENELLSNA